MIPESALIIFAKPPIPKQVKTRLGSHLGDTAAAGVYARLLYGYLLEVLSLTGIHLHLAVAGDVDWFQMAFPEFEVWPQEGDDLGSRMGSAFGRLFDLGYQRVVLTGSDCPGLNSLVIRQAFDLLERDPVVLGPAWDGGYVLVGQRDPGWDLFGEMTWSVPTVLEETRRRLRDAGQTWQELDPLGDVDTEADYQMWRQQFCIPRCSARANILLN